ncbi:MAG: polysaccharide deacetylase family protein [Roseburia sp.]|nr:polysaccharide deacetylase family protein [Roseburia sp.]
MRRQTRRMLSFVLALVMFLGVAIPVQAAKQVKLSSKKVSVKVGKTKKLQVKNTTKKTKWSVVKGKGCIQLTKKKKQSVVIKGKKAGSAKVLAKVGGKKLYCKVSVKGEASVVQTPQTAAPEPPVQSATASPVDATSAEPSQMPSASPSVTPTQSADSKQPGQPVENLSIDLSRYATTKFTAPGKINFSDQLESWFDLTLFSKLKVSYVLEFEDGDSSDFVNGKIGLAQSTDTLTGYADGIAHNFSITATGTTAEVDLSGEAVEGTAVGINIQPMNASYNWPDKLVSITITGIEFVAASGAVYPDPNAPAVATETPGPTYPPEEFRYEGLDTSWIDASKPMVAFTFDDGPVGNTDTSTSMIIQNALTDHNAHATFFYIGSQINSDAKKDEIRKAKERGFEIGNHSYGWDPLSSLKEAKIKKSIEDTNEILKELTGYSNFLFRAPNLSVSDAMKGYIKAPFIDCAVDSKDWANATTEQIIENVEKAKDGDIVLMHETQANTAAAINELLEYFEEKGWQVVSVSELFAVREKKLITGTVYSSCAPANGS